VAAALPKTNHTAPSSPVALTIRHAHGGFALLTKEEAFLYSTEPGSAGKKLWQGCICIHPRPARSFPWLKMNCFLKVSQGSKQASSSLQVLQIEASGFDCFAR
jgi:hypothetical protein